METQTSIIAVDPMKAYYTQPNIKLYQGDCLEVLAKLPENSVDLIFADPPYNLSNGGFTCSGGRMVPVDKGKWDRSKGFDTDATFNEAWIDACRRVLKPEGSIWISGTYHNIYQVGYALQKLNFHILNEITWFKPNASPNLSCRMLTASHETVIWARKDKKAKHIFNYPFTKQYFAPSDRIKKPGLQMRSVWEIPMTPASEKWAGRHTTQKPVELLNRIINIASTPDMVVLDPFLGSGTTGYVAYREGRKFIGIDMESSYLDIAIKRISSLASYKPKARAVALQTAI